MALKPLNSVAGFSVGETPANIILANGDITTNNISTTGKANLNAISNVIITGGSNGQVIQTDGVGNLSFVTISTSSLSNGNSNIQVIANGNITFSSAGTANVATITSTGMNVAGYISGGNITATGNISVNNYIVTPAAVDLIVAPDTQLTRFYSNVNPFSGGYSLGNSIARWDNVFANTANIDGNVSAGNVLTNNLLYANGQPWDLQEAAGANKEIQYNDGSNNFGASANFTFDYATNLLTVNGNAQFNNANLGNLAIANFVNISSNTTTNNLTVNLQLDGNTANFTGNIIALNANLGNLVTANYANFANDVVVQGNIANANNISVTNNITSNTANVTGNLTSGNANLGNLATANNFSTNGSGGDITLTGGNVVGANVVIANSFTSNGGTIDFATNNPNVNLGAVGNVHITGGSASQYLQTDGLGNLSWTTADTATIANGTSNVSIPNLNGNVNTSVNGNANVFVVTGTGANVNGNLDASGNLTVQNANLGNLATANYANIITDLVVQGNIANAGNISVTYTIQSNTVDVSANTTTSNLTVNLELSGNTANFSGNVIVPNLTVNLELAGNTANFTGNIIALNASLGNLVTANYANFANDVVVQGNIANANNISVTNGITSNTVNVSANTTTNNLTVNLELSGNTANFSGNVIVPNLTVNLELAGNTANFTGNVIAANFVGSLSNGTSNVKVYNNANIEFTINGTANVATISSTGLYVAGEINTTTGNMLSNGNITANLFLNSANANVTGEAVLGSVKTANITAPTGDITISAAGANNNIILSPTGVGNVDVGLHNITQVALPVNPSDAATKEYVDNISQGLYIHPAANVTSTSNLNASYLNGGTVLSATTITGGKTITFSANHGLSTDSDIEFTNTFNGITAGEQYFVYSVPAANQITIKDGYFGTEVTTLTNGAGLTQPALGEGGVGATLTNAGAQAALTIDGILTTVGARVLVQGQTSQVENGIYSVTTVGTGATNWVLTRATDGNSYAPKSDTQLGAGSYFFVMQGSQYAGSSYVLTAPPGEINFGTSNIVFSQFSQAGAYTAGNGIAITGTLISANVDLITTDIVAGNIVVKTGANLTTPNLGDATFSSLSWNTLSNGNVTANNLSIGNIANITGNLRVDGIIESNGNVTSNAFINGNNASFTNSANIGGNLLANNITSNNDFSTNTANISSNLVTSNATVNLELSGNTANFSGNVVVNNLTVNLELAGNTANFTGNIVALNTNAGNLLTANFANIASNITTSNLTVNLELAGNTANFSGNIVSLNANLGNLATANFFTGTLINGNSNVVIPTANGNINLTAGGNTSLIVTATGANITGNLGVTGNFSVGNLEANILVANTAVEVGNTTISSGSVTTTSITANQTIATYSVTGVTGLEFIVKGIDSTGSKYSMATVQAVTDGTNADYSTFSTVNLGGQTGVLAVNIVSGNVALQVTPASSNSTVWTTQVRFI